MKQWKNHFFTADFTDIAAFLVDKPVGYIFHGDPATVLTNALKEHDPRPSSKHAWNDLPKQCHFNVIGAKVKYNGRNSSMFRSNTKFSHVMVLDFTATGDHCPQGDITLQYNWGD